MLYLLFDGKNSPSIPFTLNRASPQAAGLVGWWPTVGQTGGVLRNRASALPLDATLEDNAALAPAPIVGQALALDGTNDRAYNGSASLGMTGDAAFTVAFWLNPAAITSDAMWFSYGNTARGETITLGGVTGPFFKTTAYGFDVIFYGAPPPALNTWQHVALTYNPATSTALLYVDGTQRDTWAAPDNYVLQASAPLRLGQSPWGTCVGACQMADVRLYNRALSAAEIWSLYAPQTR